MSTPFDRDAFLAQLDADDRHADDWAELRRSISSADEQLTKAHSAFMGACREMREVLPGFAAPDPSLLLPRLDDIGARLIDFCAVLTSLERSDRYLGVDHARTRRMAHNEHLTDAETAQAYDWARHLFELALACQPLAADLRLGWSTEDWSTQRGAVLRSALRYIELLLGMLAGEVGFAHLPLGREEVCDRVVALARCFRGPDELTAAGLARAQFELGNLDHALARLGVRHPRPAFWGPRPDTRAQVADKLDLIVSALSSQLSWDAAAGWHTDLGDHSPKTADSVETETAGTTRTDGTGQVSRSLADKTTSDTSFRWTWTYQRVFLAVPIGRENVKKGTLLSRHPSLSSLDASTVRKRLSELFGAGHLQKDEGGRYWRESEVLPWESD